MSLTATGFSAPPATSTFTSAHQSSPFTRRETNVTSAIHPSEGTENISTLLKIPARHQQSFVSHSHPGTRVLTATLISFSPFFSAEVTSNW